VTRQLSKIYPELQRVAKIYPNITYSRGNLWLFNLAMRLIPSSKTLDGLLVENIFISRQNADSKLRLRIYKPLTVNTSTPVLLWIHGGGYLIGKPEQDDSLCVQYVRELSIPVVSVEYRLAPKHPFPAPLDDCYSALKWIASHAEKLNIDPRRIAVGGNSAGSGLAAALAQLTLDRQEIELAFQLLIYPMLDDRTVLRTDIDDSNNVAWNHKSNRFGWESYLGQNCGAEHAPAYSVPARRADLSGLPPAWIGVGDLDIFHDEDVAYAQRLKESGVECELKIIPGAFHGFDVFDPQAPVVQEFLNSQIASLKKYLFL
jgi:acetyl esterase/lipase